MTRRGVAGVRLCHASPCKYPAGKCPLHGLPRVGEPIDWSKASHPPIFVGNCCDDMNACLCGYAVCSCTTRVIDAEFAEVEPEPPKDVLPEGWRPYNGWAATEGYVHDDGPVVFRLRKEFGPRQHSYGWGWDMRGVAHASCGLADHKPTRELAMAAALQSVSDKKKREHGCQCHQEEGDSPCPVHGLGQPAEPALRPGWQWNEGDKRWDHQGIGASVYQRRVWGTWVAIAWGGRAEPGHTTLEAAQLRAEAIARGEP